MKIGILGLGAIASCVARDLAQHGHELLVTERSKARSAALMADFASVQIATPQEIIRNSALLFLGTTGAAARVMLPDLALAPDQPVVSLMADIDRAPLQALIAPARLEAVMIPFPWIAAARSPVLTLPQSEILKDLFGARHDLSAVADEDSLRAFLTAQAVLSPSLKLVAQATGWLAQRSGDEQAAEGFLRMLVGSALMTSPKAGAFRLSEMLEALDTPGGYNQILRQHMEQSGAFAALDQGLNRLGDG